MSNVKLQEEIVKGEGFILSDGTLNIFHLLPRVYDLIENYELEGTALTIKNDIEGVFENAYDDNEINKPTHYNQYHGLIQLKNNEEADYIWHEVVFSYLNEIAPENYYFGSTEGDGACIGFFKSE